MLQPMNTSNNEAVKFIINGKTLSFFASSEICQKLLTDDAFTIDYVRRAVLLGHLTTHGIQKEEVDSLDIIRETVQEFAPNAVKEVDQGADSESQSESQCDIGSPTETCDTQESLVSKSDVTLKKGKYKEFNKDMTSSLMLIRGSQKYQRLFNDKKSVKAQLWKQVAQELHEMGYNLGEKSGEKCRQKFANLQKGYLNFKNNMKQTGAGSIEKPWYYDDIEEILGDKHKINPPLIIDSESETDQSASQTNEFQPQPGPSTSVNVVTEKENAENIPETPKSKTSRFNAKKNTKPISSVEILHEIHQTTKQVLNENRQLMAEYFKKQEELQQKDNEYKESIINLLKSFLKVKKGHKRKHSSDSDCE